MFGHMQELISGLNRRLDQLHNQASRAQDDANQRRQRVAVLEAQSELLTKDNQRLLHESTDHAAARYRLEAERDTQRQLSSQQHDEDAKERGRLHSELSSLQGQLADSQKQLTEAQSDHKHSFSAQETADARYGSCSVISFFDKHSGEPDHILLLWQRCHKSMHAVLKDLASYVTDKTIYRLG